MKNALVLLFFTISMKPRTNVTAPFPDLARLQEMASRFVPTPLSSDVARLEPGDRKALVKLIEAGRLIELATAVIGDHDPVRP